MWGQPEVSEVSATLGHKMLVMSGKEHPGSSSWKRWLTLRKSGNYRAKEGGGRDSTSHLISITILQISYYFPFTNLKTKVLGC